MTEIKARDYFARLLKESPKITGPQEYILFVDNEEFAELLRKHTGNKVIVQPYFE